MKRNRGYPVNLPVSRVRQVREKVPSVQDLQAAQNGDIFTFYGGFDLAGPFPVVASAARPEYTAIFRSNLYYNCIEIDAIYPASARGWVVPDLWKLALDDNDNYFGEPIPGFSTDLGPKIYYQFGAAADELITWQHVYHCAKTYIAPAMGDPTNTSSLYGKQVFRLYGLKAFRCFKLGQWTSNGPNHTLASAPEISFRVWHDKKSDVLRSS